MTEEIYTFRQSSEWSGGSDGDGVLHGEGYTIEYGRPKELGGKAGRISPEEMLLSSIAACYSITLAIIAERRRIPITDIHVEIEGDVIREQGGTLRFTVIRIFPRIKVASDDASVLEAAMAIAHKTDKYCLISNAVRTSVQMQIVPEIIPG
ncbi:MAG: OsmC family protein [Chthonomonadales bacterium]